MGYFVGVRCSHCGYEDDFAFGRGAHDVILDGERTPWYCPSCQRSFGLKWLGPWRVGGKSAPPCPVCHGPLVAYRESLAVSDDEEGELRLNECPRCHARALVARFTGFWD